MITSRWLVCTRSSVLTARVMQPLWDRSQCSFLLRLSILLITLPEINACIQYVAAQKTAWVPLKTRLECICNERRARHSCHRRRRRRRRLMTSIDATCTTSALSTPCPSVAIPYYVSVFFRIPGGIVIHLRWSRLVRHIYSTPPSPRDVSSNCRPHSSLGWAIIPRMQYGCYTQSGIVVHTEVNVMGVWRFPWRLCPLNKK